MKKIICLLLALACSFALFSCGDDEVEPAPEDALIEIAGKSEPTQIKTYTYYTEKSTEIVYKGEYTTVYDGANFVLDYTYQKKAMVSLDAIFEGSVQTVPGQVQYKDGKYSTDGGETWGIEAPDATALAIRLNVTKENLGTYTLSSDDKTLTATLTPDNAKALLGIDIPAESVWVEITTNGTYLTGITIEYSTELADVVIASSYSYIGTGAPAEEAPAEDGAATE